MAEFAPQYPRNDEGWVLFPINDINRRRELFPEEVFNHPAKANIYLIEALIEYLTEPGQTVLDPFGGTGTILIAATVGRNIITVELEQGYHDLILSIYDQWLRDPRFEEEGLGNVISVQGDCRLVLPIPCHHAIFSPPYSTALGSKSDSIKQTKWKARDHIEAYSASVTNLAQLNVFYYGQAMRTVYQKIHQSLSPGGSMTVIIKDQMKGNTRVFLSQDCIRWASAAGFVLWEWYKWRPKGSPFTDIAAFKGANVVRDEDIIIFRKG